VPKFGENLGTFADGSLGDRKCRLKVTSLEMSLKAASYLQLQTEGGEAELQKAHEPKLEG